MMDHSGGKNFMFDKGVRWSGNADHQLGLPEQIGDLLEGRLVFGTGVKGNTRNPKPAFLKKAARRYLSSAD